MRRAFEMADRVAATDSTVLILGESGTGKDLLAQEIHARSQRNGKAYVAVNCAALPETLIESELFGYERGAFTGAAQQKKGRFEQAHGGTLFLDEIGDMNPVTQSKVLRALENRTIERLGGHAIHSRGRARDQRDASQSSAGDSRRKIPRGSFLPLARGDHRTARRCAPTRKTSPRWPKRFCRFMARGSGAPGRLTKEALTTLERYDWPGNVRELKNAMERAMVLCRGEEVGVQRSAGGSGQGHAGSAQERRDGADLGLSESDFREAKRKFEIAYLRRQLAAHRWNISRTAATIGLHRQSLQERLRELGIRRPGQEIPEEDDEG